MTHPRTLRAHYAQTTRVVCVVGSELNVNLNRSAPPLARFYSVKCTPGVHYGIRPSPQQTSHLSPVPLRGNSVLLFCMSRASQNENDSKLSIQYYGDSAEVLGRAVLHLTAVEISLDVDADRDGVVEINNANKGLPETPIFTDTVVFRVSPWIMTPNTLRPVEVFVCSTSDNYKFLKSMKNLVAKAGYKLKICSEYVNRGDRWMQDECEFGYIDSPHQRFPVVLDSPRNGDLDNFPYDELLGPDFGYVSRVADAGDVSSLDSFGNLEVSPPVTVRGTHYPLGRIIIGVAFPTATKGRNMTKVVQDFLWAQKVQEPIALFSDWLFVGHVDEFMTFVPAPDRKGFRLLLASPDAAYKLFRGLHSDGHGQARLFEGLKDEKTVTVDEILDDKVLRAENDYVQSCIDWNRDVLKRELGLDDEDIVDLPILFKLHEHRALPYYPDMVNMIVLGRDLGIPKPFGPQVHGRCALEAEMLSLLCGLGLSCTFIDDFATYHKLLGEVHCGSNVRREPFDFKWWNLEM
ncbi:protein-arginine deiminase type-2 isoform 2-T2 [Spinachia spinachia]